MGFAGARHLRSAWHLYQAQATVAQCAFSYHIVRANARVCVNARVRVRTWASIPRITCRKHALATEACPSGRSLLQTCSPVRSAPLQRCQWFDASLCLQAQATVGQCAFSYHMVPARTCARTRARASTLRTAMTWRVRVVGAGFRLAQGSEFARVPNPPLLAPARMPPWDVLVRRQIRVYLCKPVSHTMRPRTMKDEGSRSTPAAQPFAPSRLCVAGPAVSSRRQRR